MWAGGCRRRQTAGSCNSYGLCSPPVPAVLLLLNKPSVWLSGMGRSASLAEMACIGTGCSLESPHPCPSSLQDLKRVRRQTQARVRDFQQLYELVKNQRNKFVSLVAVAGQGIAELKEKLKMLGNEFEVMPCSVCLMFLSRTLLVCVYMCRCFSLHCAACQGLSTAGSLGAHAVLVTITDLNALLVAPVTLSRHLL